MKIINFYINNVSLRKIFFYSNILFLFNFNILHAQEISEIMYDPEGTDTNNEWIEIYNNTDAPIDITTYKLFEANTNHTIATSPLYANKNSKLINPFDYAVIADNVQSFLNLYPNFSGQIFDSSFSLLNTGEELALKNSKNVTAFNVNYKAEEGANGTGGTLNYISGLWKVFKASPSASSSMEIVDITKPPDSNSTTSTTTTSTNTSYSSWSGSNRYTLGDLKLLTPKEINTVVGAETEFFVKSLDSKSNILITSTYWSFGDGAEGFGTSTKHRYQNSGVYNAYIESEVYNSYGVEKIIVKVENPDIKITDVQANYVELYNNSDIEINIGRFIIASDQGMYKLSRMFIISPKSFIKIDGRVMGFSNLTNVKLMSAYNTFITKYENQINQITTSSDIKKDFKYIENNINKSTTTNILNAVQKKPLKYVSYGLPPKMNTKVLIKNKVDEIPSFNHSTNTVEKTSTNIVKKWLYWLYE